MGATKRQGRRHPLARIVTWASQVELGPIAPDEHNALTMPIFCWTRRRESTVQGSPRTSQCPRVRKQSRDRAWRRRGLSPQSAPSHSLHWFRNPPKSSMPSGKTLRSPVPMIRRPLGTGSLCGRLLVKFCLRNVPGRVDEPDMAEGLREVTQELAVHRIDLFGQ
jgi:hypothetical protein